MSGNRLCAAHAAGAALAAVAALAGCASAPSTSNTDLGPPTSVVAQPGPQAPAAPAPVVVELSPAQARAQAQRLAVEAVDQLQNGDEPGARGALDRALELDPGNELARKLMDQVKADAEKELGPVAFRYTVQRDDSLSKLAQQFLGDRLRFYILAKYNGIANPSRLGVGQVLRIPGKASAGGTTQSASAPSGGPMPMVRGQGEPEARPGPEGTSAPSRDATGLVARGMELRRAGDLEGAYAALSEAVRKEPANRDAMLQRNSARQALISVYEREAAQAFQRQNLDLAIARWDRILELDPAHRKARLERERAIDLQKKMNEKFGAK